MGERGTGITTQQLREAPEGAVFVWCNHHISYPRDLAAKLGRRDLRIEPSSFFEGDRWRGLRGPVVVDHAFMELATRRQRDGWAEWASRYEARQS